MSWPAANPDDPAPIMQTLSVSFLVSVDCISIDAEYLSFLDFLVKCLLIGHAAARVIHH
jgi:hypothetical protein